MNQIDVMERVARFRTLLAAMIGVEPGQISDGHIKRLLLIGRGMFWSEYCDLKIQKLAIEIDQEFTEIASMNTETPE